jgi:uncharacterized membrane protein
MKDIEVCKAYDSVIHRAMTEFLRMLTVVAGLLIVAGGALLLSRHGDASISFGIFSGEPASLRVVSEIAEGAFHLNALAVVQLGIVLLIATPVLRVLFVGVGYLLERDWLYVTIAAIVLCVLAWSLIGGAQ